MKNQGIHSVFTIGVYGFTADRFYATVIDAGVDLLVDVRWRRGVRGSTYAFANSRRLQQRLAQLDIAYIHRRDLAPTPEIRKQQHSADTTLGVGKKDRAQLAPLFKAAFKNDILAALDPAPLRRVLAGLGAKPCFLCVEKEPLACHRSLIVNWLTADTDLQQIHLQP